jgi:hypothetical protein
MKIIKDSISSMLSATGKKDILPNDFILHKPIRLIFSPLSVAGVS